MNINNELKRIIELIDQASVLAERGQAENNEIKYHYWVAAIVRRIGQLEAFLCVNNKNDIDPQLLKRAEDLIDLVK